MDGSIVVLSIRYLQRSMAGKNIRQMAYDNCQHDYLVIREYLFTGILKNIPQTKY
jgi:hypothetical protein